MAIHIKINCRFNDRGAWCNNAHIKRSLLGFGARCCVEYDSDIICLFKEQVSKKGPSPLPPKPKK